MTIGSRKRRLSGWARVGIALFLPVWALATWFLVSGENRRWATECDWNGCPAYVQPHRATADGIEYFLPLDFTTQQIDAFLQDATRSEYDLAGFRLERQRRLQIQYAHDGRAIFAMAAPALGALLALGLLMLARVRGPAVGAGDGAGR